MQLRCHPPLASAVGALEVLKMGGAIAGEDQVIVDLARASLEQAAGYVAQFQRVARVVTKNTPIGPSLDLTPSTWQHDGDPPVIPSESYR